jgi:plasmid stabilization system protein ParE
VKVRFTPSGRLQFLTAIAYIQRDDHEAALKFRDRSEHALRRLLRFPVSGRLIPEFPDLPFREIIVPPYRFFYRREGKLIWIVAVWHGAQIPKEPTTKAARTSRTS